MSNSIDTAQFEMLYVNNIKEAILDIKKIQEKIMNTQDDIIEKQNDIRERLVKQETCLKNLERNFKQHLENVKDEKGKSTSLKLAIFGAAAGLFSSMVLIILTI